MSFEIRPFTKADYFASLCNEYITQAQVEGQRQPVYLAGYLEYIGAKQIVIERQYIDGDYMDDFTSYYATCFEDYPRFCRRLHFFSQQIPDDALAKILAGQDRDGAARLQEHYLGFVVARPLPETVIGRTILRSYPSHEDNRERFYQARRHYDVSLFGLPLSIKSLAFQQQDTAVAACATVALWSAFHKTAQLFGSQAPRPARITLAANLVRAPRRALPTHALRADQMCEAIRAVGLEPEFQKVSANTPLASFIYGHVAMGIPVILGVEINGDKTQGHAFTVTGYSIPKTPPTFQEMPFGSVMSFARQIDEFYIHDDNVGPFARVRLKDADTYSTRVPFVLQGLSPNGAAEAMFVPVFALAPVYPKIRLTFLEMHLWAQRITAILVRLGFRLDLLEWDICLSSTNDYKKFVRKEYAHLPEAGTILTSLQPHYMWRARLRNANALVVDILGDATGIWRSCPLFDAMWYDRSTFVALKETFAEPQLRAGIELLLTPRFTKNVLKLDQA